MRCAECSNDAEIREWCRRCYHRLRRAGNLPPRPKRVTNVDEEERKGDCAIHGRVTIRVRERRGHVEISCRKCDAGSPESVRARNERRRVAQSKRLNGWEGDYSQDDYEADVTRLGGMCEICQEIPEAALCIDHDHETKRVRGLLCSKCNAALGLLRDDPEVVESAARYLRARTDR